MRNARKQIGINLANYRIWSALVILIFLGILFAWPGKARSQAITVVSVEPQDLRLNPGETGSVSVMVQGAAEFYGFEIQMRYDPTSVQIRDADADQDGIQVKAGDLFDEKQGFLVRNQADNQTGELIYAFTLLAPAAPISGSGTLIEFEIQAVSEGSNPIDLDAILASQDGFALHISLQDGLVTVGNTESAQPTSTSTTVSLPTPTEALASSTPASQTDTPSPAATSEASHPTLTPTDSRTASTSPAPAYTETPSNQMQEPTYTPEGSPSTTSVDVTEVSMAISESTQNETGGPGTAAQDRHPLEPLDIIFLVAIIIILAIGFIAGGLYLNRREPNDS